MCCLRKYANGSDSRPSLHVAGVHVLCSLVNLQKVVHAMVVYVWERWSVTVLLGMVPHSYCLSDS